MIFQPAPDQRALIAEAFSRPLDELLPIDRLHKDETTEPWDDIAALGIFGIAAPEELGGVGLGPVEEALLATDLGLHLAGPQIIATLMAQHAADDALRARLATGEAKVAPAVIAGDRLLILAGEGADHLLVRKGGGAALLHAAQLNDRTRLDDHHWTAALEEAAVPAGLQWVEGEALLRIRLIEAAALAGHAACARDMAVEYAKIREQFGHPIGGFQAIKHHCANMAAAAMAAADLATFAGVALAEGRADATLQVESALLLAIDAALANTRKNIQVHGGMGFSEEADPGLALKRAQLLIEAAGGADAAAARVAAVETLALA